MEKQDQNRISFEELKQAAMPLVELLRKKGHPHMSIVVTGRNIVVKEDLMGVPLEFDD